MISVTLTKPGISLANLVQSVQHVSTSTEETITIILTQIFILKYFGNLKKLFDTLIFGNKDGGNIYKRRKKTPKHWKFYVIWWSSLNTLVLSQSNSVSASYAPICPAGRMKDEFLRRVPLRYVASFVRPLRVTWLASMTYWRLGAYCRTCWPLFRLFKQI